MICVIYSSEPKFPPTDQHPDCNRIQIGAFWVDYIGALPTQQEVDAIVNRPPIDRSDMDNIEKSLKALGLVMASWNAKTPAQLKAAFKAAWDSLP